jgi:hypothetical protein
MANRLRFIITLGIVCGVLGSASMARAEFYVVAIAGGAQLERTLVVSPEQTTADSGQALLDAVAGIVGASENSPYLVLVEPGEYDLGASTLTLPDYVNLAGAGKGMTIIRSSATPGISAGRSTISGLKLSVSRFAADAAVGIEAGLVTSIDDCEISVFSSAGGDAIGVRSTAAAGTVSIDDCRITANGDVVSTGVDLSQGVGLDMDTSLVIARANAVDGIDTVTAVHFADGIGDIHNSELFAYGTPGVSSLQRALNLVNATMDVVDSSFLSQYGSMAYGIATETSSDLDLDGSYVIATPDATGAGVALTNASNSYVKVASSRLSCTSAQAIHNASNQDVLVEHSEISGDVANYATFGTVRLAYTQVFSMDVTIGVGAEALACLGLYDLDFAPVACP